MSRGYTVRYNPGRHHQIEARDRRILEEAVENSVRTGGRQNNPETERIMAKAHELIGARIDRAMAEASRRKEAHEEAQAEDPQAAQRGG